MSIFQALLLSFGFSIRKQGKISQKQDKINYEKMMEISPETARINYDHNFSRVYLGAKSYENIITIAIFSEGISYEEIMAKSLRINYDHNLFRLSPSFSQHFFITYSGGS